MPKITIGGTYWIAAPIGERVRVTCPVCAGNKTIDIILGDGERVTVPCEGCGHGYDGPRGFIMELQQEPAARQVTVSRVSSMPHGDSGGWRFQTHDGWPVSESDLFATEGEAMAEAALRKAANDERNMETRQRTPYGKPELGDDREVRVIRSWTETEHPWRGVRMMILGTEGVGLELYYRPRTRSWERVYDHTAEEIREMAGVRDSIEPERVSAWFYVAALAQLAAGGGILYLIARALWRLVTR